MLNKVKLVGIILGIVLVFLAGFKIKSWFDDKDLETYKRQLSGALTEKEKELQKSHHEIGVLRSELLTQQELAEKINKDKDALDKEFKTFMKEHGLQIKSRDRTIAELNQRIEGGSTVVVVPDGNGCADIKTRCLISYNWEDTLKRFKLNDPDIFKQSNEIFESNQFFQIRGIVAEQKDGFLQVRQITLLEVYKDKDGKYVPVPDGKANIIDSKFEYSNEPIQDNSLLSFKLIAVAGFRGLDYKVFPGLGLEFLSYKQFGLNSTTFFNFKQFSNSEQHIGANYRLKLFDTQFNFGLGLSIGTPFNNMFDEYSLSGNAIFYIND